ncbi:MAG: TonB-dependent receptor [Gammaproteobacteria bacterium]|nr:TonB-dependent receptor [Gammaproteobacteria bacterium]
MISSRLALTATLLSFAVQPTANAQTSSAASNPRTNELQEVVITATPLRRAAFATAQPVTSLGGDALVTAIRSSLGDTLAEQPGMSATSFGPIASRPIIRGQGGLRVQTFVDGADTLDVGALSDDHAVALEPLLAERVEIIRGPAALLFGTAAAAGAVNVLTGRLPLARLADSPAGELQLRGNTAADERGMALRVSGRSGEHLQYSGDLHHLRSGDLRIPDGRLDNSAGEARGGNLGLGWSGERLSLAVAVNDFRNDYGLPDGHGHADDHEKADEATAETVRLALEQRRVDLAAEWRLAANGDAVRLRAARNDYAHRELEGDLVGTRYGQLGNELRLSLDRDGRFTVGAQWREVDFDAAGEEAFLPASRTRNLGAFAFGEQTLGTVTLEAGLRLERQRIVIERAAPLAAAANPGSASEGYTGDSVGASLGVLWPLDTARNISLQLTSTERHPSATELHAYGPHIAAQRFEIGDPSLRKERGLTGDLALRHRGAGGWSGSIGLFIADYDRFITAQPTRESEDGLRVVRFTALAARFSGVEFEWSHDQLLESAAGTLGLRLFGDSVRARDAAGDPLPQIPPRRLGLEAALTRHSLRFAVKTVWNDAQRDVAAGESTTAGFTAVDAEIGYRWRSGDAELFWFARGANLLNEEMRRHASPLKDIAPLAARHLAVGIQIGF